MLNDIKISSTNRYITAEHFKIFYQTLEKIHLLLGRIEVSHRSKE